MKRERRLLCRQTESRKSVVLNVHEIEAPVLRSRCCRTAGGQEVKLLAQPTSIE